MIAVMGLFVAGVNLLYGVAIATSLSVLLVLAASLTLLPALLTFFGRRIGDSRRKRAQGTRWLAWISAIQRRPALAALVATGFLLFSPRPRSASARGQRRGKRRAVDDDPAGLRPALARLRQGLQRAALAGRAASTGRRHRVAPHASRVRFARRPASPPWARRG